MDKIELQFKQALGEALALDVDARILGGGTHTTATTCASGPDLSYADLRAMLENVRNILTLVPEPLVINLIPSDILTFAVELDPNLLLLEKRRIGPCLAVPRKDLDTWRSTITAAGAQYRVVDGLTDLLKPEHQRG